MNMELIFQIIEHKHRDPPDTPDNIASLLIESGLNIEKQFDTEFAVIFAARKGYG
jgi:hypothetical protein